MEIKECSICIYNDSFPGIYINKDSICTVCEQINYFTKLYGTGSIYGKQKIKELIEKIKSNGKYKKYDCVVGVSGGTDSSYLLHLTKEWGLRPLAVHYDDTWNTGIASQNIKLITEKLDIDLETLVLDNLEANDLYRSGFYADIAEIGASQDLGYAEFVRQTASKYNLKYVLEAHSFQTEGITPLGNNNYFDGKYISSIHKKFGKVELKSYPLMTFSKLMWWTIFKRIKFIRPLWYISYSKDEARKVLEKKYSWVYYGGHHLENKLAAYSHSIYLPKKFLTDFRIISLAAQVRQKLISREQALAIYNKPIKINNHLEIYFKKRLGLNDNEYNKVMNRKRKYWYQYPTYKKVFERFSFLFYFLMILNFIPRSFYIKYCKALK